MAYSLRYNQEIYTENYRDSVMANKEQPGQEDLHAPVYTIGVAAEMLDVSVPTLRKYEEAHFIIPHRTESGHRRYSSADIDILRCVRKLITTYGVSLNGIARLLALIPCWEIKGCSAQERNACDAYYNEDMPCWSAQVKQGICTEAECRTCPVYDTASNLSHLKGLIKGLIQE